MTTDEEWMRRAIELAHLCPPSETAFSVGAIIVDAAGEEIANGYSRDTDPHVHAEESALAKLPPDDPRLSTATIYSTLEPCTKRKSRPLTCTQLILNADIPRAVIAWREPDHFVTDVEGVERLRTASVTVIQLSHLASQAREPNSHIPGISS